MKRDSVQRGWEAGAAFPGRRLGGAPGTAALDHLLHLLHEGGAVRALERVFPPLAPQRPAALAARAAPSALQPRHLLGGLAGGVTLLLLVIISHPFPLARDFWRRTKSTSILRAVAIRHGGAGGGGERSKSHSWLQEALLVLPVCNCPLQCYAYVTCYGGWWHSLVLFEKCFFLAFFFPQRSEYYIWER